MCSGNSSYKDLLTYKSNASEGGKTMLLTVALVGVSAATVAGVYWLVSKI